MRKIIFAILFIHFSLLINAQIIADHTVVDKYDDIPQQWIDSVKTKLVWIMGMSHGYGYFRGVELLELIDNRFQAEIWYHVSPPSFTSSYMRLGRPGWGAEGDFYTNSTAISNMKSNILTQITNNNPYDIIAFGWSYQGTWHNDPGGIKDPVYNVRWAGSSVFGPDGDQRWGLDSGDSILTGNRVCMDTYLAAMEEYRQYCLLNDYPTKMLFTNGVVDENSGTESGYQRELKNQHIREYAQGKDGIYFLDYADILVYNSNGERYTVNWDDGGTLRPHDQIHPDNMQNLDASFYTGNDVPDPIMDDHIGDVGALRLGKALWWILARMTGWDGTVNGADTTSPSTPSGLGLQSVSNTSCTISWNASTDNVAVTAYNIYRDGLLLTSISGLTFTDNTLEACTDYIYSVTAVDDAGNESLHSQDLAVSTCMPDLAPTLIVTPNISHGITTFDVIVRVTELNMAATNGAITIHIPKDDRWDLNGAFNTSLTLLDGMSLDNQDWTYTSDLNYHIFNSTINISPGGFSTFGFSITFNPDTSRGLYTITTQLVSGSGGETRDTNNADSEKLDYFQ